MPENSQVPAQQRTRRPETKSIIQQKVVSVVRNEVATLDESELKLTEEKGKRKKEMSLDPHIA